MIKILIIAAGGGLGAVLRYLIAGVVQYRTDSLFPLGTLTVNVIGCLFIGILMSLVQDHPLLSPNARAFLAIGLLGSFTTFSTFGYEASALLHDGEWSLGMLYVLGNLIVGLGAVELGRLSMRLAGLS